MCARAFSFIQGHLNFIVLTKWLVYYWKDSLYKHKFLRYKKYKIISSSGLLPMTARRETLLSPLLLLFRFGNSMSHCSSNEHDDIHVSYLATIGRRLKRQTILSLALQNASYLAWGSWQKRGWKNLKAGETETGL